MKFEKKHISRAATAKLRKTLESTINNLKIKEKEEPPIENLKVKIRPETANNYVSSHSLKMKINSIYSKMQNQSKNTKLNLEKGKIRSKLLKLLHNSIILNDEKIKEYEEEFKNTFQKKKKKRIENNLMHFSPLPNSFSNPDFIYRYEDIYETPMEFIKKNFNINEIKIMIQDPVFFHLDKIPLNNANLKLHFSLTSKLAFEEEIKNKNKDIQMFVIPKINIDKKTTVEHKKNFSERLNINAVKKSRNEKKLDLLGTLPISNKKINFTKIDFKKKEIKSKSYQNTFREYENRKKTYLNDRQYERNKKYFLLDKMNDAQKKKNQKLMEDKNIIRKTISNIEKIYSKKKI